MYAAAAAAIRVLLVLPRVLARLRDGDGDQRRRAVELAGRLGAGGLLEPRERLGAEHAEPPGVRQVVVRRPARELEQLLEGRAVHRLRAIGLVRAPAAD